MPSWSGPRLIRLLRTPYSVPVVVLLGDWATGRLLPVHLGFTSASIASSHAARKGHERMLGLKRRPRLVSRPSLFELITRKNIEDLSDLSYLQRHLGLPDLIEDIDELSYSSRSLSCNFPLPIQALHSTARTIRMPSKESGIGDDDQHGSIFSISGPVITAENMIGVAMYELVSFRSLTHARCCKQPVLMRR